MEKYKKIDCEEVNLLNEMKSLNVTFVSGYLRTDEYDAKYTLASMRMASYILDLDNINITNKAIDIFSSEEDLQLFASDLANNSDLICCSLYIYSYDFVKKLSHLISRKGNICIVVGGPELKNRKPTGWVGDEIFIYGEGEAVLRSICKKLQSGLNSFEINKLNAIGNSTKKDGVYRVSETSKIKVKTCLYSKEFFRKIDMPYFNKDFIWYETSRGCLYKCGYCGFRNRKGVGIFDDNIIIEEIKNIGNLCTKKVFIVDANMGGTPQKGKFVLKQFNQYAPNTQIIAYLRPEFLDDEYISIIGKSNIEELRLGVQTLNYNVPKWLRNNNIKSIVDELPKLSKIGVPWRAELIVGLPGDNLEELEKSIGYLVDYIKPTFIYAYHLTVLKETELYHLVNSDKELWVRIDPNTNRVVCSNSYTNDELKYMLLFSNLITSLYNRFIRKKGNNKYNVSVSFAELRKIVLMVMNRINYADYSYEECEKYWEKMNY